MKILVGMSGGVDSSAAAVLLKKAGDVTGVTLTLFCDDKKTLDATNGNILDAQEVCKKLNIGHTVLDLKDSFKTYVVEPFIDAYTNGLTPNPCINCNKFIKFGEMLNFAKENGYDKIATGHYAAIEEKDGKFYLKCALDRKKDQTYVLYNLTQDVLKHLLLPLGNLSKEQSRKISEDNGLITAHKSDSQDICFVPNGDYAAFIEEKTGRTMCGDFLDFSGAVIGRHKGVIHYTVGQRKGLGLAFGHRVFVTDKDAAKNTVTLGEESELYYKTVVLKDINFICEEVKSGEKIEAKLRYAKMPSECVFEHTEDGAKLHFINPQRAPTPGQAAVFYKGDYCLGGGTIVKGEH